MQTMYIAGIAKRSVRLLFISHVRFLRIAELHLLHIEELSKISITAVAMQVLPSINNAYGLLVAIMSSSKFAKLSLSPPSPCIAAGPR